MNFNQRKWRYSAVVVSAMLFAAACGSAADSDATATTAPAADAPAADAPAATTPAVDSETTVATVSEVGLGDIESTSKDLAESWNNDASFTFVYSVDTTGWEPNRITTNNSFIYLAPIYDTLIHINEEAVPEPLLAESWELVEDNLLELTLIEDWQFHDGAPFNAEAVKANLDYHRSLDGGFNVDRLSSITNVEAVDERTVRIETEGSASPLIGILGSVGGMMMSPDVLDDPEQSITPTGGSGAYRLVNYVPGSRADYERVDGYWDPDSARVKDFTFLISNDDNARLNFVITGEANSTFLRAAMVEPASDAGLQIIERPSLSSYNINLNTERSEFGNVQVRQALNYAIDREAIGNGLLNGLCQPGAAVFPTWYWAGTDKVDATTYARDLDRSRELLAEAGLADGFEFDLHVVNIAIYQQIAEVVQSNWAEIGVTVNIIPEDIAALADGFSISKTSDAQLSEQKGEADPSMTTAVFYLPTGLNNPGGFSNPDIERLHYEAMAGATPEERDDAYEQLIVLAAEQSAPNLTICTVTTPFTADNTVQDLPVPADGSRWFRGVSIAE